MQQSAEQAGWGRGAKEVVLLQAAQPCAGLPKALLLSCLWARQRSCCTPRPLSPAQHHHPETAHAENPLGIKHLSCKVTLPKRDPRLRTFPMAGQGVAEALV